MYPVRCITQSFDHSTNIVGKVSPCSWFVPTLWPGALSVVTVRIVLLLFKQFFFCHRSLFDTSRKVLGGGPWLPGRTTSPLVMLQYPFLECFSGSTWLEPSGPNRSNHTHPCCLLDFFLAVLIAISARPLLCRARTKSAYLCPNHCERHCIHGSQTVVNRPTIILQAHCVLKTGLPWR